LGSSCSTLVCDLKEVLILLKSFLAFILFVLLETCAKVFNKSSLNLSPYIIMSWRIRKAAADAEERRAAGIYENVPKDNKVICNALVSGGIERGVRARSEKKLELVDSWFSKSFQNAVNNKSTTPQSSSCHKTSNGEISARLVCNSGTFEEREKKKPIFENNGKSIRGYRGSKTTSLPDTSSNSTNEWDFLTTLNEILREENFIGENYNKEVAPNSQLPLSPRPPRPLRRNERRNKEYNKTKSLDPTQFQHAANLLQLEQEKRSNNNNNNNNRCVSPYQNVKTPPPPPPPHRPNTPKQLCTSNNFQGPSSYYYDYQPPHTQHFQNFEAFLQQPTTYRQQSYNNNYYERPPTYNPPPPLPPKPINNLSTSLDSIYDKLKVSEAPGGGMRPLTQIYHHGYPPPPISGYYNNNNNGYPPYLFEHSSSVPRVWPSPDFLRSRSFGSLKVDI
jgi:hypothetical protein